MIHFDAKHQKSEAKTKVKYANSKRKNRSETKIKRNKAKKGEKIDLNFASLCFASKQKLLLAASQKNGDIWTDFVWRIELLGEFPDF